MFLMLLFIQYNVCDVVLTNIFILLMYRDYYAF